MLRSKPRNGMTSGSRVSLYNWIRQQLDSNTPYDEFVRGDPDGQVV